MISTGAVSAATATEGGTSVGTDVDGVAVPAGRVAATLSVAGAVAGRLFLKHWRQSTGRPCVGLNGTVVLMPHSEHSVRVSVLEMPAAAGPLPVTLPAAAALRRDLHGLQRLGSFLNCLSMKKSCSTAVKTNSPPQSTQVKSRSTNSIPLLPLIGKLDPRHHECADGIR